MVFSTEVCSTFTAMSLQTLLSDHVNNNLTADSDIYLNNETVDICKYDFVTMYCS